LLIFLLKYFKLFSVVTVATYFSEGFVKKVCFFFVGVKLLNTFTFILDTRNFVTRNYAIHLLAMIQTAEKFEILFRVPQHDC